MNDIKKALINEAVRELNISDEPDLYHSFRRWIRKNIKRKTLDPIDTINWPKGCLMVGLMHQAVEMDKEDGRSNADIYSKAYDAIKTYIDEWISKGSPIYRIDDCMAGQALLSLTEAEKNEEKYIHAANKIMTFLFEHDKDAEDCLPYRPNQENNCIFADGIGMMVPFAIRYGLLMHDEAAINLGMNQIRGFMENGIDPATGLPWHAYMVRELDMRGNADPALFGDLGWGRGCGWIMYGLRNALISIDEYIESHTGESAQACERVSLDLEYINDLRSDLSIYLINLTENILPYRREDGLWGCNLLQTGCEPDTSATAMLAYGCRVYLDDEITQYITSDGLVMQAQGECIDFGTYGPFGSYPWSVGMTLLVV